MRLLLIVILIVLCSNVHSQNTTIPDPNFEQALIDFGYDSGIPDGFVPTNNINSVVYLDVSGRNIADLTGVEDFDSLDYLDVTTNQLTSLNVSGNSLLTVLKCGNNMLPSIDLSQNPMISELRIWLNNLSSLDLSSNTNITIVEAFNNQLTDVNLSGLLNLFSLNLSNNMLNSIDISEDTNLTFLVINENLLTSLDVTQISALGYLQCQQNQLTELNVTQNSNLIELRCGSNQLTGLNVSQNSILTSLTCSDNLLSCLDINNENNLNMTTFIAVSNPNLACIKVDNEIWATTYWTVAGGNIDPLASFSSTCINPCYIGLDELNNNPHRKLIKIIDYMGRETKATYNTPLFYIYDDGSVERNAIIQH